MATDQGNTGTAGDMIDTPGGEGGDAKPRANGLRFYSPLHERLTLATVARDLSGGMVDALA
jgi:hypothetical protein